jgi:hypothetical protein
MKSLSSGKEMVSVVQFSRNCKINSWLIKNSVHNYKHTLLICHYKALSLETMKTTTKKVMFLKQDLGRRQSSVGVVFAYCTKGWRFKSLHRLEFLRKISWVRWFKTMIDNCTWPNYACFILVRVIGGNHLIQHVKSLHARWIVYESFKDKPLSWTSLLLFKSGYKYLPTNGFTIPIYHEEEQTLQTLDKTQLTIL